MSSLLRVLLVLICWQCGVAAWCQSGPLLPGEEVQIVSDVDPSFGGRFKISRDGWLAHPVLGLLPAAGRDPEELASLMKNRIAETGWPSGEIQVRRKASSERSISYSGAVARSGTLPPTGTWRLSELVALAQPLDSADLSEIQLTDALGTVQRVAYDPSAAGTELDIRLFPGDRLFFPVSKLPDLVSVVGAVRNPGTVPYEEGITVRRAIELAGGLAGGADTRAVIVERDRVVVDTINLELGYNAKLRRGDIVRVNALPDAGRIVVSGAVVRPGPIPFAKGMSLTSAIKLAGGPTSAAKKDAAVLVRRVDGRLQRTEFNLAKIAAGQQGDPALLPDDVVDVPFRNARGGNSE